MLHERREFGRLVYGVFVFNTEHGDWSVSVESGGTEIQTLDAART